VRRVFSHGRMIIKRGSGEQRQCQIDAQYIEEGSNAIS
jgi:hypothetical protein